MPLTQGSSFAFYTDIFYISKINPILQFTFPPLWWPQQGQRPLTHLPLQWLQQCTPLHGNKDSESAFISWCCLHLLQPNSMLSSYTSLLQRVPVLKSLIELHLEWLQQCTGLLCGKKYSKALSSSMLFILHINSMQHVRLGVIPAMLIQPQFLCCQWWLWITFCWQWCSCKWSMFSCSGSHHDVIHSSS